jgi:type IV secretory pathway VirB2 component (pilin)
MTKASSAESQPLPTQTACQPIVDKRVLRGGFALWVAVLFGFTCLGAAYVFAFRAAHKAQIKEVPLATKGGRP